MRDFAGSEGSQARDPESSKRLFYCSLDFSQDRDLGRFSRSTSSVRHAKVLCMYFIFAQRLLAQNAALCN